MISWILPDNFDSRFHGSKCVVGWAKHRYGMILIDGFSESLDFYYTTIWKSLEQNELLIGKVE